MLKRVLTAGVFSVAAFFAAQASAQETDEADNNENFEVGTEGLTFQPADSMSINLGGRLHYDAAVYEDHLTEFTNRGDFRRARLELGIQAGERLRFRFDYDWAGSEGWRNAWAAFRVTDQVTVRGGSMIAPFSMEDMGSSNELTLMERGLANALAPGYGVGGAVQASGDHWTAMVGWFGEPIDFDADSGNSIGEGWGARVTVAPIRESREVLHFGIGFQDRDIADDNTFRLAARPESGVADDRFLDTGSLAGVEAYQAWNGEIAYMRGPFSIQGEYAAMNADRANRPDPSFEGGYVTVSYVITGERRRYSRSSGVLGGVRVRKDRQALEVAARYSFLDLESQTVSGGREENMTLGLNWYLNRNVRIMANFIHAQAEPNRSGDDEHANIGQMRLQVSF
jgi:phosphate-selective porin OprO and OprP